MDLKDSPAEAAFRQEVRDWIKENLPQEVQEKGFRKMLATDPYGFVGFFTEWNKKLLEKGWLGFGWPKEVGGGGASPVQQAILNEEMTRHNAPPLGISLMGLGWVGPSIVVYGNEEQKKRFVPGIFAGTDQWCQGFSEPGAGSDLASLKCRAVRQGDYYIVNGQKLWTSIANLANWIMLLVRTDTNAPKKDGITCLLVDMTSPGITARTIKQMNRHEEYSEVFFEDVKVPVENRLGEENKGWQVAKSTLVFERSGISETIELDRGIQALKETAKQLKRNGNPLNEDPVFRQKVAQIHIELRALRLLGLRILSKQNRGQDVRNQSSVTKLGRLNVGYKLDILGMELLGGYSQLLRGSEGVVDSGKWTNRFLAWPGYVIGGGTPHIQKNIIAERILGLAPDDRNEK
jgi:alkylation response protein AidB-like acyl-CoA dehydrogenase